MRKKLFCAILTLMLFLLLVGCTNPVTSKSNTAIAQQNGNSVIERATNSQEPSKSAYLKFSVKSVEYMKQIPNVDDAKAQSGYKLVVIALEVENIGSENPVMGPITLIDDQLIEYQQDVKWAYFKYRKQISFAAGIDPGAKVVGSTVYQIPESTKAIELRMKSSEKTEQTYVIPLNSNGQSLSNPNSNSTMATVTPSSSTNPSIQTGTSSPVTTPAPEPKNALGFDVKLIDVMEQSPSSGWIRMRITVTNNSDKAVNVYKSYFVLRKQGEQTVNQTSWSAGFKNSLGYYDNSSAKLLPGDVAEASLDFNANGKSSENYSLTYVKADELFPLLILPKGQKWKDSKK